MPSLSVTSLQSQRAYSGFAAIDKLSFKIPRLRDGVLMPMEREIYERGNSVAVLPYDPKRDTVLLIRQFLAGAMVAGRDNCPLQVIAGMVDDDEVPEVSARREAGEEAGLDLDHLVEGPKFLPSPGGSSEFIRTYLAITDLEGAGGNFGLASESEDISAHCLTATQAIDALDAGRIEAAPAVVLLSWFARRHVALREQYRAGR